MINVGGTHDPQASDSGKYFRHAHQPSSYGLLTGQAPLVSLPTTLKWSTEGKLTPSLGMVSNFLGKHINPPAMASSLARHPELALEEP